ncbi:MAG: hypothetical protein ACRDUA_14680 [Micromonosporaceae bacterium]
MSEERHPVDEVDAVALRDAVRQGLRAIELRQAKATQWQHLSLTATALVCTGVLTGFIGFALGGFTANPLGTAVTFAIYVFVLTPLAAVALAVRTERVVTTALGAWGLSGLVMVLAAVYALVTDEVHLAVLHLIGAAMLGSLGLWLVPGRPDEE